ncbi:MAG: hypothetical protein ABR987_11570 [Terracidiphilus sp.]|jgi:hypothetical protein
MTEEGSVSMKAKWAVLLIFAAGVTAFLVATAQAQTQTQKKTPAGNQIKGCICRIDDTKSTITVVPWTGSIWDAGSAKTFVYQDRTLIHGETEATIAQLKGGRAIKSFHLTGISTNGISGDPFEINNLSQCVSRRTTLHWSDDKGVSVATRIDLPYLFDGESMPAMVGSQGARSIGSPDGCPCRLQ